jgi:hypothetical protein
VSCRTALASAALVCGLSAFAVPAAAQGGSADAEELFKQGRAALATKDYETACARFAASLGIERAVGTLISLAECEEARGRLAGARQHWQEAGDLAEATNDRLNRGPFARKKFAELDPKVPRIVIHLAAGSPRDVTIQRDDVSLGAGVFDVPLPVDPGAHVITAVAPGRAARKFPVTVGESERITVEVAPGEAPAVPPVAPPEPAASTASVGGEHSVAGGGWQRPAGYVAGGLGIVGVGLGTFFGLQALSKWSSAKSDCGAGCPDGSTARAEKNAATTDATISTIGFAVGGVALAGAVVLVVTAPAPQVGRIRLAPSVLVGGGGFSAWGAF